MFFGKYCFVFYYVVLSRQIGTSCVYFVISPDKSGQVVVNFLFSPAPKDRDFRFAPTGGEL